MSNPYAGSIPLVLLSLMLLVAATSQRVWANENASFSTMMQECAGRDMDCFRSCRQAWRGFDRQFEACRTAYKRFKTGQTEPATGAEAMTDEAQPKGATPGEENSRVEVDKVTIMGVRLCGDVVEAGEYLEGQGYKNAAMFANSMRKISVSRREGNNNYDFKINYGGPQKRDAIYLMSFQGSFPDGSNPFESEKSKFEQATGFELTCNRSPTGPSGTRLECKYPSGEADRSRPGFSYSIANEEGQNAFFVDAAAWGYEDCGP